MPDLVQYDLVQSLGRPASAQGLPELVPAVLVRNTILRTESVGSLTSMILNLYRSSMLLIMVAAQVAETANY